MTAHLEISLLPDPQRAAIARVYRDLADENRRLHDETGTDIYRDLADIAAGKAEAWERGVSLLIDGGPE